MYTMKFCELLYDIHDLYYQSLPIFNDKTTEFGPAVIVVLLVSFTKSFFSYLEVLFFAGILFVLVLVGDN